MTEIEHTLDSVQNQTSNLADTVDDLIATISKLGHYWAVSSFSIRQEIQKIVFPDGVLWDRVKDDFRTLRVNGVLDLILLLSAHYESVNTKKEQKSNDFCPMVAGVGFEPHDLRVMSPTSYQLLYPAILDCKYTDIF